jgi:hypothetical protein
MPTTSPGRYPGEDNGWILSLIYPVVIDFNKSIIKYPNIARSPGGASNDLMPNLQNPKNPVPAMDSFYLIGVFSSIELPLAAQLGGFVALKTVRNKKIMRRVGTQTIMVG